MRVEAWRVAALVAALVAGMAAGAAGCEGGGAGSGMPGGNDYEFGPILEDTVERVILPTYKALFDDAARLEAAVAAIETEADLQAAQEQWIATRVHWERSEAFLWGPVADLALDPALDSWPVDRVQLDQVLASGLALTPESLTGNLGGGLKGFHTIEYLLFGIGRSRTAAQLTAAPRQVEYLRAAAGALRADAEALYLAWAPEGDAFGEAFARSGQPGGRYFSQVDAVQQLVNGCADIADEVANGKIADPYKERNPELVESQFSYNSLADFVDNVRSIRNVYEGVDGSLGLAVFVAARDPNLDARVRAEIQAAIDAIRAISPDNDPPFRDAILDPAFNAPIEAAQAEIRTLMRTLQGDVMATLFAREG
ncbi:MAG: peptidase M75 [Deltaproteobacteria bacterium]|nr:peptidase M75 [Deltaproteobacteria bacterium]